MAFIFDFKNCLCKTKKVSVDPKGWRGPLEIEYGQAQVNEFHTHTSIVWRVVGTTHTFCIYERELNRCSNSDYAKHFTEALEEFREDYLSWWTDERYAGCDWRDEYREQYGNLIKANSDNEGENQKN